MFNAIDQINNAMIKYTGSENVDYTLHNYSVVGEGTGTVLAFLITRPNAFFDYKLCPMIGLVRFGRFDTITMADVRIDDASDKKWMNGHFALCVKILETAS